MFSRLKQLRKDFDKASTLKNLDRHNLLANVREVKNVDDILKSLKSSFMLTDSKNMKEFHSKVDFIKKY